MLKNPFLKSFAAVLASLCLISASHADKPELQTPSPFIYLEDNLDEVDRLGWCIDTIGRGFAETLQAHSCKPWGGDVQFVFKKDTGHIASVAFDGKCMTLSAPENAKVPFGLHDCSTEMTQKFVYDAATLQFRPAHDQSLCVAVAPTSRSAGPYMSRDLVLAPCDKTDSALLRWRMQE